MTEPVQVGELLPGVLGEVVERAGHGYARWAELVAQAGYCHHPIRLAGRVEHADRATGDAIPTRIRDNCQVAISFATRTIDGAVAALGEEIRQHPDASPVRLNDPAYVGVAVTSLPGHPGFHRVRTPQVDHHQVAAIIRVTTGLRRDPAGLLAEQAPGLHAVPPVAAPGEVA